MPKKEAPTPLNAMSGRRLRAVREVFETGGPMKQEEFADALGIGRTTLANWEGGMLPDVRAMVRLEAWLGIPLEWIYLGRLRHVERELSERLAARAVELGAPPQGMRFGWGGGAENAWRDHEFSAPPIRQLRIVSSGQGNNG